ncbi:MAG: hypothetical protein BAJALOKI1v1_420004 [Promethearchaeota archaeon]|nr:MAG: hypothetical protein BAJALOKI1v1_420004 [Candidatus Lokiarchaeota archaeon]
MINYGITGYGLNSLGHKNELQRHPLLRGRTKLIVGFDPNPEAQQNLKKIDNIKIAESFEDLLDTANLDAVIICSPPQFHAQQAIVALEAGLHVYSEIPMCLKEKNIENIIAAEQNPGRKYQLGENYCFIPEVLYSGHLASSGKIGPTVYAESEYLHDVSYRWKEGNYGDPNTPRIDAWYQLFDPLMYAHSIGPAQVALGGINTPEPFMEVISYANNIGGYERDPICSPAKAFHVGLFRTERGAIAKCANAYVFAREPTRMMIQVVGRTGTYECYEFGKPGRLFLAKDHIITKSRHRKGRSKIINADALNEVVSSVEGLYYGGQARIIDDWLTAIEKDQQPKFHSQIGANFCISGIAASKSARSGGKPQKIKIYT